MLSVVAYLVMGCAAAGGVAWLWRRYESAAPPAGTLIFIGLCWLPIAVLMLVHVCARYFVSPRRA